MAPETSAGSARLNITVYPSGWTVCWLTEARPTVNGPRTRYSKRWSFDGSPALLQDPQALVEHAARSMPSA
jgi:hypothetical protein